MSNFPNQPQHATQAVYCNHVEVSFNTLGVRIAFGETPDPNTKKDVRWHSAIFVPTQIYPSVAKLFTEIMLKMSKPPSDANN